MGWSILYSPGSSVTQLGAADLTTVQNAVDAAATGATIRLPLNSSATWGGGLSVSGKYLTIDGNGSTITKNYGTSVPLINVTNHPSGSTRITGFNFRMTGYSSSSNGYEGQSIIVGGGFGRPGFRIDHNTFTISSGGETVISITEAIGVLDNNTFTMDSPGNAEMIHVIAYGNGDTTGWSYDVVPGSADAVYIEDNSFINQVTGNPAAFLGCSAVQNYYGARTVFRHNYCRMAQIDIHGTPGAIGGRWYEIYQNEWNTVPNGDWIYMHLRAGSGVIWGNTESGSSPYGSPPGINMEEEDSGSYPLLYQVGRGKNQAADPLYIWGNGSIPAGGDSNIQVNRDYYYTSGSSLTTGARPGYTPYTYPHPLRSL